MKKLAIIIFCTIFFSCNKECDLEGSDKTIDLPNDFAQEYYGYGIVNGKQQWIGHYSGASIDHDGSINFSVLRVNNLIDNFDKERLSIRSISPLIGQRQLLDPMNRNAFTIKDYDAILGWYELNENCDQSNVTITNVTEEYVEGNFNIAFSTEKSDYLAQFGWPDKNITITNGYFKAKILK